MGREGLGEMSENGELLADLCWFNGLVVGGSIFPRKRIYKATWISPDHQTENQIDHICISVNFRRSLQDVHTRKGADIGSDHHLVEGKLKFKLRRYPRRAAITNQHYNTALLKEEEVQHAYQIELTNWFWQLNPLIAV